MRARLPLLPVGRQRLSDGVASATKGAVYEVCGIRIVNELGAVLNKTPGINIKFMRTRLIILMIGVLAATAVLPACKAKSCDTANNIDSENGRARKKKKNLGLFSRKEMRRKRY